MKRNKILAIGLSAILGTQSLLVSAKAMEDNEIAIENTEGLLSKPANTEELPSNLIDDSDLIDDSEIVNDSFR